MKNAHASAALRPTKGEPRERGSNPTVRCERTAPLAQGSRGNGGATPQSGGTPDNSPYTGEPRERGSNPSVRCGGQLPLHSSHRNSFSSYSGVSHDFFSLKSTLCSSMKNAHASAALRPTKGEPKKRGGNPSVRCGGQLPLHRGAEGTGEQPHSPLRADSSPCTGEPGNGGSNPTVRCERAAPLTQGSRGNGEQPLSPLRRTAPLAQGSQRKKRDSQGKRESR